MKRGQSNSQRIIIGGVVDTRNLESFYKNINCEEKKFDNYIIAYLDFLGFAEKMKEEHSFESLQKLKLLLKGAESVADSISSANKINDFDIKIFSDNVVIAQKIESSNLSNQITCLINLIGSIQLHALIYFDFLIRGGITIGELFIDSTVVWGTGLIEAYSIENSLANYPRILLSSKLLKEYDSCVHTLNLYAFIKEDFDGFWFIDFLVFAPNITLIPSIAERLHEIVAHYVEKPEKVKQKINWIISYFNAVCDKHRNRGDFVKCKLPFI